MTEALLQGVVAVDKPEAWTSFDVVAVARRVYGVRRVGHGGTLDPLATGVLPVLVGGATRFADRLHTAPKVYAATVRFGAETATDDREGPVTREASVPERPAVVQALAGFRGEIMQRPPSYAAVKVAGRRAYDRARAGEQFEIAARRVQVYRLDMTGWNGDDLGLLLVCSAGTYVRAIARDLGRACSSAAHLASLRRLAVGALDVASAVPVERLRTMTRDGAAALLRPADDTLLTLDTRYLEAPAALVAGNA